jgi:ATP adenylyltransferase
VERLWAPWRMAYITRDGSKRTSDCVFCDAARPGDDRERLVVYRSPRAMVVLNRFPYNNGHLLVMPVGHIDRLDRLDAETFAEVHELVKRSIGVLEQVLRPEALNLGMNLGKTAGAGIAGHLHYHLVPRWDGDTNFMPVVGETKVISQHILETYDTLKPGFDAILL